MMTFIYIVVGLFVLGFILLWMKAVQASGKLAQELDRAVEPALAAAKEGSPEAAELLLAAANQPSTRNHLIRKLRDQGQADLFPPEFRTVEKVAESDLCVWLMHANELAAEPSKMELVRKIAVQEGDKSGHSFLFRFRSAPGHWAAERGWMAGSTGPYWDGEVEIGSEAHPFSELVPFDKMTEEEHVRFIETAMNKKGLVVPS